MSPRRRRFSLGMRWSLRYGALILGVIALVGFFAYRRTQEVAERDAEELLELQASYLARQIPAGEDGLRVAAGQMRAAAPADLKLSIQFFAAGETEPRIAVGVPELERLELAPAARAGEATAFREVRLGKKYPFWVLARRLDDGGYVQIALYGRSFIRRARRVRYAFLAAVPLAVVASLLLGVFVSRSSLRPVAEILASARRIGSERLDERIPVRGTGDEFDQIAGVFNDALDRIEAAMAALRRYSVDAAHQLRTPLTALRGRIEVALRSEDPRSDVAPLLEDLLADVVQLSEMVDAMLSLARSAGGLAPGQRQPVELGALLDAVVDFFLPLAHSQGRRLRGRVSGKATVLGDPTWLRQLFVNLVDNAIRYTGPGACVGVELEPEGTHVTVRVRDDGPGIPPQEMSRVFERFHRVEPSGGVAGAGLGLALAQEIARVHGGVIWAEETPGGGATFCVRLPLADPQARAAPPRRDTGPRPQASGTSSPASSSASGSSLASASALGIGSTSSGSSSKGKGDPTRL